MRGLIAARTAVMMAVAAIDADIAVGRRLGLGEARQAHVIDAWRSFTGAWAATSVARALAIRHIEQRDSDLSAEYRLRNLEIPYHLVEDLLAKMRKEVRNLDPENAGVRDKIQQFLDFP
jgi:hypothetical protein